MARIGELEAKLKPVFRIVLLLALAGCSFVVRAQTRPVITSLGPIRPNYAIFIGNSYFYYNGGMPRHVGLLEEAAAPEQKSNFRNVMVAISGYHLAWHDVESYFRPNTIRNDSIGHRDDPARISFDRRFGVAVMMDCSQCPIHPALRSAFAYFTKKDSAIIRAHGARPVLFMSWAYAGRPEMTALLEEAYTVAGNANAALVIPAGLAFAHALQRQPELNLYADDKSHPSLAGTYLAACTTFAALTGRSPVGNPYDAGLEAPTARLLQEVAWDTVQNYYKR